MIDRGIRGNGLETARIASYDVTTKQKKNDGIKCMFNPHEYTVSKSNTYHESKKSTAGKPDLELENAGVQTLKLNVLFDTYEDKTDVSLITNQLWKLMDPLDTAGKPKKGAPFVVFEWGSFFFVSVITNMTQKFTLFAKGGVPVRAKVDITFTQHVDEDDYRYSDDIVGTVAEQIHDVVGDERLDNVAAKVLGAASEWAKIADHNNIDNPFAIRPGQQLQIPGGL